MKPKREVVARRAGLNLTDSKEPGFTRKKGPKKKGPKGKPVLNWHYFDTDSNRIKDEEIVARINSLAIPPAWTDVWICSDERGFLQALGVDSKGRKQYRYHADWTKTVAEMKFDSIQGFAEVLPTIRASVKRDLALEGMPKSKVVALVIWLMNSYSIRVGSDEYAQKNQTYGLSTLTEGHMTEITGSKAEGDLDIELKFVGKSGKEWKRTVEDDDICRLILASGEVDGKDEDQDLFMFEDENGEARDLKAEHINEYLNAASDGSYTAKDFRTWRATWTAAAGFSEFDTPETKKDRKKLEQVVVSAVSDHLGNTPAVCRSSYIHPAIIEDWMEGVFEDRWMKSAINAKKIKGLTKSEYITLAYLQTRK